MPVPGMDLSPRMWDRGGCYILMEVLRSWGSTWSSQKSEMVKEVVKRSKEAMKRYFQMLHRI